MAKKIIAWLLLITVTATAAIGGTLAYLTDRDSEANVFTTGDVSIDLNEDFDQGATLLPGVDIEKKPTITNVGENDAWVWAEIAIPTALDNEDASQNIIHFNFSEESLEYWKWTEGDQYLVQKGVKVPDENGMEYNIYTVLYKKALKPGETTAEPVITKVYMDPHVDIDPNGDWYHVENGVVSDVPFWNVDKDGYPVIYVSAYAIQTEGFDTVQAAYDAYATQWGNQGKEFATAPKVVTNPQELKDAMLVRNGYVVLGKDIIVDAATPLQWGSYMFVANGREVTIDLNGFDIIVNDDAFARANALFTTANGGTLNIVGEGTVEVKNGKAGIFHAMNKNDQINVYGGTYISNSDNGSDALALIYTNSGNVDVYGGKFISPAGVGHANAQNGYGNGQRLATVYHEGALLNHDKYYNDSDKSDGRIKLEDGCELVKVEIDGEIWYQVKKAPPTIKVASAEELREAMDDPDLAPGTVINGEGVTVIIENNEHYKIPGGITLKNVTYIARSRGGDYMVMTPGMGETITFENCTFTNCGTQRYGSNSTLTIK